MSARKKVTTQARPIRFRPDALDVAQLSLSEPTGPFVPEMVALIYDESPLHGCGLVLTDDPGFELESLVTVKVGRMDPVRARVVWKKAVQPRLIQLGLQYLD